MSFHPTTKLNKRTGSIGQGYTVGKHAIPIPQEEGGEGKRDHISNGEQKYWQMPNLLYVHDYTAKSFAF